MLMIIIMTTSITMIIMTVTMTIILTTVFVTNVPCTTPILEHIEIMVPKQRVFISGQTTFRSAAAGPSWSCKCET